MRTIKLPKLRKLLRGIDLKWLAITILVATIATQTAYSYSQFASKNEIIEQLQGQVDVALSELEYIQNQPTPIPQSMPTPVVIKIKETNREKIAKIDARIAEIETEIEKVNEFLDEHQYNQDAQARRRDLLYELGQLKMERIRYE